MIYVRAALELLRSPRSRCAASPTSPATALLNLLRLNPGVGFALDSPLPVPPVFELIAERAEVAPEDMWETFNMGCGFCCVVPAEQVDAALALLSSRHPGSARIGTVTADAGVVELPGLTLRGK